MSEVPINARENAVAVVRTLRDAGHVAYFAGGCVRDALLGLVPKDYDVATDAPPPRVRQLFRNTQAVGAAFGVILVRVGGSTVEVATFRSDGDYADGRRPERVTFATAGADAQRRDFTINGLFYDPDADRVIDHVGGQTDLAARVLRAIGDPAARFAEDHLRLLRAVRFAARFGLSIEPATAAAIDAAAPLLPRISAERTAEELRRVLTPTTRGVGYGLLLRHGLIAALFSDDPPRPVDPGRSVFLRLAPATPVAFPLAVVAVTLDLWPHGSPRREGFAPLGEADARAIARRWRDRLKLSNDEVEAIADIGKWAFAVYGKPRPDDALLKRLLARPNALEIRQLLEALDAVDGADGSKDDIEVLRLRLDTLAAGEVAPTPLLNGDQLIAGGARPSPVFKKILDEVYAAQLNGTINDAAGALAMGLALYHEDEQFRHRKATR